MSVCAADLAIAIMSVTPRGQLDERLAPHNVGENIDSEVRVLLQVLDDAGICRIDKRHDVAEDTAIRAQPWVQQQLLDRILVPFQNPSVFREPGFVARLLGEGISHVHATCCWCLNTGESARHSAVTKNTLQLKYHILPGRSERAQSSNDMVSPAVQIR